MRRTLAAIGIALALFMAPMPAAHAVVLPDITNGHWSYFKWPGYPVQAIRMFYVLDRTGAADTTAHDAMQAAINDFYYDLDARSARGIVPAPVYLRDDANAGQCDSTPQSGTGGFTGFVGYSFITVCAGGPAAGTSITWTSAPHHAENYHPSIWLSRTYTDFNSTYSLFMHELLHAEGMRHTDDCTDLMGGGEYGCALTVGVLKKPSGLDYDGLVRFYGGYGVWGHPWNS